MGPLEFLRQEEQGIWKIRVIGEISESSEYPNWDWSSIEKVEFDMAEISLINSTGIQAWIKFFEQIPDNIQISMVRANVRVINQINQFPGFLATKNVQFHSFFAPYFCETCDRAIDIMINSGEHKEALAANQPPEVVCECEDKKSLEFDSVPKKYFKFLRNTG